MAYVGKPIGAANLTWFPITAEEEGAPTYGTAVKLSRLINIVTTPAFMEATLESDDGMEDDLSLISYIDVTINASQLTDTLRAQLLGHSMDADGGVLTTGTDVGQYGALAWKELLSKQNPSEPDKYKYVVLYKGKFKEFAETANTLTQGGITYQTHNLTGRFYKRDDGSLKYSMREDTESASASKIAAWFTKPQEKAETEPGA